MPLTVARFAPFLILASACEPALPAPAAPVAQAGPLCEGPAPGRSDDLGPSELELPPPSGPCATAQRHLEMVDDDRAEPNPDFADESRRLSVYVSYPTNDGHRRAPYLPEGEARAVGSVFGWPAGWERDLRSRVWRRGAVAGTDRLPVVLLSHGLGLPPGLYRTYVEELVSHGFVVVALAHTYDTVAVEFPDGEVVGQRSDWWLEDLDGMNRQIVAWARDAGSVLDALEDLDADDPEGLFTGRLDLQRVGMMGHSFGGAAARQALADDPRVVAALNLDGSFVGRDVDTPLDGPLLILVTPDHGPDGHDSTIAAVWDAVAGAPAYLVTLEGTTHGSFGDVGVLSPHFGSGAWGSLDPVRALRISRAYTHALFDHHLRGAEAPLLSGDAGYPEASLSRRG